MLFLASERGDFAPDILPDSIHGARRSSRVSKKGFSDRKVAGRKLELGIVRERMFDATLPWPKKKELAGKIWRKSSYYTPPPPPQFLACVTRR